MGITIRGTEAKDEIKRSQLLRDPRNIFAKAWEALEDRTYFAFFMGISICIPFIMPEMTVPCLFLYVILYLKRKSGIPFETLPFRMPVNTHSLDRNDMKPGRQSGYNMAQGKFYVGQEHGTKKQLWLKIEDVLTHLLVLGTTGSGKTEFLVSLAFNALALGSGFFYVDPKGAPKLAFQVYVLTRMLGRDDDYRLMSYNTGGKSVSEHSPKRMSNSQNPFSFAPADAIEQLIVSLIPKTEGGNAIFSQNAQVVISGIIYGLVELRDRGFLRLSTQIINEHLNLSQADALARDPRLSEVSANHVKTALRTVGWREETPLEEQLKTNKALSEQFGYARAYFGQFLNQLGYTYGYIFNHEIGEIDMRDIILERRILVVILPSLEKSPQELEALGKITLSAVRNAVAVGLGDSIQGTAEDILFALPTDAPSPFLSITDEYAAIPTPGYAEVLTQGRGLGVCAIVASQDWGGIKGGDEKGAKQIASNVKIKFAMTLEDALDTWEFLKAQAGKMLTMNTAGYRRDTDSLAGAYYDNTDSQASEVDRVHIRDLQEQTEGEFHAFFKGRLIRGFGFFVNPPINRETALRIAQMLPVTSPEEDAVRARKEKAQNLATVLRQMIEGKRAFVRPQGIPEDMARLFMTLRHGFSAHSSLQPVERAICAFLYKPKVEGGGIGSPGTAKEQCEELPPARALPSAAETLPPMTAEQDEFSPTGMVDSEQPLDDDLFALDGAAEDDKLDELQEAMNIALGADDNSLEPASLNSEGIFSDVARTEELLGATPEEAKVLAHEAVEIVRQVAQYPQSPRPKGVSAQELDEAVNKMLGF